VKERDITGLKYFQQLLPLFDRLHGVGCRRGKYRGGSTGPGTDGLLRIATNLPGTAAERWSVPAEIIAEIYRHRWTIEIFFRFFKHVLGCRQL